MENNLPEWISAIASLVSALGLILVLIQVKQTFDLLSQTKWVVNVDHERSRREIAIDLFRTWTIHVHGLDNRLTTLGRLLSQDQAKLCYEKKEFTIQPNQFVDFQTLLDVTIPESEKQFTINRAQSVRIRAEVVSWLNMLECLLTARRHQVADPDLIHEQFRNFYNPTENQSLYSNFRAAAGNSETFPAITAFEQELRSSSVKIAPAKGPSA